MAKVDTPFAGSWADKQNKRREFYPLTDSPMFEEVDILRVTQIFFPSLHGKQGYDAAKDLIAQTRARGEDRISLDNPFGLNKN